MPEPIELLGLSDVARRVLGHLPVWTDDEEAFQQAELDAGASESIRSYTAGQLTARLEADRCTPDLSQEQVEGLLEGLRQHNLAVLEDGGWRMTHAGFEELTGEPVTQPANLVGGPVDLDLQEAQAVSGGEA